MSNVRRLDSYRSEKQAATRELPVAWLITGPDCHLLLEDEFTTKLVVVALNNAWLHGRSVGREEGA